MLQSMLQSSLPRAFPRVVASVVAKSCSLGLRRRRGRRLHLVDDGSTQSQATMVPNLAAMLDQMPLRRDGASHRRHEMPHRLAETASERLPTVAVTHGGAPPPRRPDAPSR